MTSLLAAGYCDPLGTKRIQPEHRGSVGDENAADLFVEQTTTREEQLKRDWRAGGGRLKTVVFPLVLF